MTTIERRRFEESLFNTWKRRAENAEDFLSCSKNIAEQLLDCNASLFARLIAGETLSESEGLRQVVSDLRFWVHELRSATSYGTTTTS